MCSLWLYIYTDMEVCTFILFAILERHVTILLIL